MEYRKEVDNYAVLLSYGIDVTKAGTYFANQQ